MRAESGSTVSAPRTLTASCITMGPESSPSSTTGTVAPLSLTPCSRAWRCASSPGKAGRSAGWTFRIRPRKARTSVGESNLMKPARHTSSTPCSRISATRSASNASRDFPRWSRKTAGMPALRARSSPGALSTFEITIAISPPSSPFRCASMRACRFEPRPLMRTPIFFIDPPPCPSPGRGRGPHWQGGSEFSSTPHPVPPHIRGRETPWRGRLRRSFEGDAFACDHGADDEARLPPPLERMLHVMEITGRHDRDHPYTHVEDAVHLLLAHRTASLDETEKRRHRPGLPPHAGAEPGWQHARDVAPEAAPRNMGESPDLAAQKERLEGGEVAPVGSEECGPEGGSELRQLGVDPVTHPLE